MKKKKKALKGLALTAAGAAAVYFGFGGLLHYEIFERSATLPTKIYEGSKKKGNNNSGGEKKKDARVEWMHSQDFHYYDITNDRGHILQGYFLPSETPSNRYVLCSHGYRSRGRGEFRFVTKFLHENGFNVFLVDHAGSGYSEGSHISFGYHENRDLLQWVHFMLDTFGQDIEIMLYGISMGSASVLMLNARDDLPENVKFTIADCSYSSIKGQFEAVTQKAKIPAGMMIKTLDKINKIKYGFSLDEVSPLEAVRNAKRPILFIHGLADGFIPCSMGQELYANCVTEKDLLLVEHAGHSESYQKNSKDYEAKILEFSNKYFGSVENAL